jgi:serine/threonine-protein kinase
MLLPDASTATGERTKVLDFGIAKLIEANNQGSVQTRATELLGTPNYMSPEQCRGAKGVDEKTDVYALGVMMFEMLTGQPPFVGSAIGELMAKHMYEPPPKVSSLQPQVPDSLASLVDGLLDKDKEKRPTMIALEGLLDALTESLPPPQKHRHRPSGAMAVIQSGRTAHPDAKTMSASSVSTGVMEKPRRTLLYIGLLASLLCIGGGVTGFVLLRKKAQPTEPKHIATTPRVHWRLLSVPDGAKVIQLSDGSVVGETPLAQDSPKSSSPLRLRLEHPGFLPHEVQISLEASGEVQVVLHSEPPKPVEEKPVDPKAKPLPVKRPKRPVVEVPHIEN